MQANGFSPRNAMARKATGRPSAAAAWHAQAGETTGTVTQAGDGGWLFLDQFRCTGAVDLNGDGAMDIVTSTGLGTFIK